MLAACGRGDVIGRPADPAAAALPTTFADSLPACAESSPIVVDTVATGLVVPWDIAFLPDGRVLVTERTGGIRVLRDGRLDPEPWAVLDVHALGEGGLMGIDVAPDFGARGHVFVAGTFMTERSLARRIANRLRGVVSGRARHAVEVRVVRLTDRDGRGADPVVVADGVPAGLVHSGGALRFGPDGRLHLGTGDTGIPALSGNPASPAGKILRVEPDAVVARGFRNVQGMDWRPADRVHFAVDHGPTGMGAEGGQRGLDELNVVEPGGDHGWPVEMGRVATPSFRPPRLLWANAIAPAGMAFWRGGGPWSGDLFVAALAARDLIRIRFDPTGAPICTLPVLDGAFGRVRAVRMAPDGWLWITTSNRDGRGRPRPNDDLLLRIRPEEEW